ncbi:MAG: D-alanyl-D-alanine carboxypeptidase family protein [Erysipelotrichaceae bacterium]|nr:D-alanyl-D-alanine carboxypeptidase family protein [Erysipelotrichaceae bacterium]
MAQKKKRKLSYWQRVYLTLKIRTKRLIKSLAQDVKENKIPRKYILGAVGGVLAVVLFFVGTFAYKAHRISTQTDLGYTKEEAQLILDKQMQTITKEYGYSKHFVIALGNDTYDKEYTPLYFYVDSFKENTKNFYNKLVALEYTQEEIKTIFKSLEEEDIVPLFIFEKQTDITQYISDIKKGNMEGYLKPYENTTTIDVMTNDALVTKKQGLSATFIPEELTSISQYCAFNPGKLTQEATTAFNAMCMDAKEQDIYFASMTAYRSYEEQSSRYAKLSEQYGSLQVDDYTPRPGHDEHQTGLAVNVSSMASYPEGTTFVNTNEYAWLVEHAASYGFIFRYPEGKEFITGMDYEPSHLRYVGVELAELLHTNDLTLEEYHAIYK